MKKMISVISKCMFVFFTSIIAVSCIPKEEKPNCCEQNDTVKVLTIDTSLLYSTPYFKESKRFSYVDSVGNQAHFLFNQEYTLLDYYYEHYTGVCDCDENYLQRKLEYSQYAKNNLYSSYHASIRFGLYVYFEATPPYNAFYEINYKKDQNLVASFITDLDDYNADLPEITINNTTFYDIKLVMGAGDTIMVANFTQGVVAFKDSVKKWWTLDHVELVD